MNKIYVYLQKQEDLSFKENLLSYYHFQFIFIIINGFFHEHTYKAVIDWVIKSDFLFQYYPSADLYLKHLSFFIALLIVIQLIILPAAISIPSYISTRIGNKSFLQNYKLNLNAMKFIPFILVVPYFFLYFIVFSALNTVVLKKYLIHLKTKESMWTLDFILQQMLHFTLILFFLWFYIF